MRVRTELSSPHNPLLKQFRRALQRGELTPDGCCAVEGVHLIEEAFRSPARVMVLLAARSAENALARFETASNGAARSYILPDRLFRGLAQTETPQGVAALVQLRASRLEECLAQPRALAVVLAGVQDPGNLGAILRALEAFGGTVCLLTRNTVSPFNAKAVRASAGSLFRLPVFSRLDPKQVLTLCREHGFQIAALSPRAPRLVGEIDFRKRTALLIGQEGGGLPAEMEKGADLRVRIPVAASVESLNAAMAATLALYEAARQRGVGR